MKRYSLIAIVAIYTTLSGCAAVPMASVSKDSRAKKFYTTPRKSNIYLYRNEINGGVSTMSVNFDGKPAGETAKKTYFKWSVRPGKHTITSLTENTSKIELETESGENYFIWQEARVGFWTERSKLHLVSQKQGEKGVLECKLAKKR
jgi:hypothetical protein